MIKLLFSPFVYIKIFQISLNLIKIIIRYQYIMSLNKGLPFLGRLFAGSPRIIKSITKNSEQLNEVIPNVYENLLEFSSQFLGAIHQRHLQYLKLITKPELFQIISNQIAKIEKQNITIKQTQLKNLEYKPSIEVRPYVIFNDEMRNRKTHHFDYFASIGKNKFFNFTKSLSLVDNLRLIRKNHIYGFHCYYLSSNTYTLEDSKGNILNYQQKNNKKEYDLKTKFNRNTMDDKKIRNIFLITYETDSENLDFQIVDCNCYLQDQLHK